MATSVGGRTGSLTSLSSHQKKKITVDNAGSPHRKSLSSSRSMSVFFQYSFFINFLSYIQTLLHSNLSRNFFKLEMRLNWMKEKEISLCTWVSELETKDIMKCVNQMYWNCVSFALFNTSHGWYEVFCAIQHNFILPNKLH